MDPKHPLQSRTLWTAIPGSAIFLADAGVRFLQSGALTNLCAQRSALAGGLLAILAFLRFKTTQPLGTAPKGDQP